MLLIACILNHIIKENAVGQQGYVMNGTVEKCGTLEEALLSKQYFFPNFLS